jgi:phosphoribosylanthranilate isomerase
VPASIVKVAVMVNKPLEEAIEIVTRHSFGMVQLHGTESPDYCDQLRKYVQVIKAFPVKDSLSKELDQYEDHCDFFLFDTKTEKHGGSGMMFDHTILEKYDGKVPFFLGGGIHPSFADDLTGHTHPLLHALDINSRFEASPGIKDIQILKEFFIRRSRNF